MLHTMGCVVWHNVPKLRDLVVINPQWLVDAMAGVGTFIELTSLSRHSGMTNWNNIRESLKLK